MTGKYVNETTECVQAEGKCDAYGNNQCCSGLACDGRKCIPEQPVTGAPEGKCKKEGECCEPISCIEGNQESCCCAGSMACQFDHDNFGFYKCQTTSTEKPKCAKEKEECDNVVECCNPEHNCEERICMTGKFVNETTECVQAEGNAMPMGIISAALALHVMAKSAFQ